MNKNQIRTNRTKIFGCKRSAMIRYIFDPAKTVFETRVDIQEKYPKLWKTILVINGEVCGDAKTIKFYQDKHPNSKFVIVLRETTPKDLVYNFRRVQHLKNTNNTYVTLDECVVCLDRKPHIANGTCYHDSILCGECAHKLDKCPFCFANLDQLENI